jgi:hypothetical protein
MRVVCFSATSGNQGARKARFPQKRDGARMQEYLATKAMQNHER